MSWIVMAMVASVSRFGPPAARAGARSLRHGHGARPYGEGQVERLGVVGDDPEAAADLVAAGLEAHARGGGVVERHELAGRRRHGQVLVGRAEEGAVEPL